MSPIGDTRQLKKKENAQTRNLYIYYVTVYSPSLPMQLNFFLFLSRETIWSNLNLIFTQSPVFRV